MVDPLSGHTAAGNTLGGDGLRDGDALASPTLTNILQGLRGNGIIRLEDSAYGSTRNAVNDQPGAVERASAFTLTVTGGYIVLDGQLYEFAGGPGGICTITLGSDGTGTALAASGEQSIYVLYLTSQGGNTQVHVAGGTPVKVSTGLYPSIPSQYLTEYDTITRGTYQTLVLATVRCQYVSSGGGSHNVDIVEVNDKRHFLRTNPIYMFPLTKGTIVSDGTEDSQISRGGSEGIQSPSDLRDLLALESGKFGLTSNSTTLIDAGAMWMSTSNSGAGIGATATITITDFTELNTPDKVNLVATDGTNYDFSQGDQSSVNGTFEATTSNHATATNLMNVINTSSGPSGTRFTATVSGATVTVTQAAKGVDGNTTVTLTDSGTAGMTKTDFIDGGRHRFGSKEVKDGRGFIRIYNPSTEESVVASYTGISGQTFTGIVGDVDFTDFMAAQTITDLKVVPSYYVPGGSTRFFAARRLRDHAEVSGNSPDMAHTRYFAGDTVCYNAYNKPVMTPMPYPRMGHHFVTPTMPMLPGHWAHPAYQSLYKRHLSDYNTSVGFVDSGLFSDYTTPTGKKADIETALTADAGQTTILEDRIKPMDAEINFSGVNASPSGPSDIHGGAFTLMFETGLR